MRLFAALSLASLLLVACSGSEAGQIESNTEPASSPAEGATEQPTTSQSPASPTAVPTATPQPAKLTKLSDAFAARQNSFDTDYRHDWVVMLRNDSTRLADFVKVQALFFSDANVLLATSEDYAYVWPGQSSPASGYESLPQRAARMEVRIEANPKFSDVKTQLYPSVGEVKIVRDRFSSKVTGIATSPWTTTVENLSVVCVLKDAAGNLVGVDSSFLDLFPGGATAVVECPFITSDVADAAASAEVYLVLSSISTVEE